MSYRPTLNREIDKVIEAKIKGGQPLHPTWITHAICESHKRGLGEGDDADFWRYGGYRATRDVVTARITKITGATTDKSDNQPTLPGFAYVQTYYVIPRDGEDVGVPTDLMSNDELVHLEKRLRGTGVSFIAHADELGRYRRLRSQAAE